MIIISLSILDVVFETKLLKGDVLSSIGLLTESEKHYEEAFLHVNKKVDRNKLARATIALNTCLHSQGKLNEALDGLLPLLNEEETLPIEIFGSLHRSIGNTYRSANKFHDAEMHLTKAVDLSISMEDEKKKTEWMGELGRVYRSSGLHHKALMYQTKAYDNALQRGDLAQLASICGEIGFTNYSLRQPNHCEAIRYLGIRFLLASNVLQDTASMRWCLNNLGKVYHSMGTLKPAIECFRKSLQLVKGTGNLLGEGTALGNLGSVLRDACQYEEAVKYHKLYLANAGERLDIGGEAIMLRELAFDCFLMEDYSNCQAYAIRGLLLIEKIRSSFEHSDDQLKLGNHEKNEARIFNILQLVLRRLGQYKEALLVSEMSRARAVFDLLIQKHQKVGFQMHCSDILHENTLTFDSTKVEAKCTELSKIAAAMSSNILVYSIVEEPAEEKTKWLYMWLVKDRDIVFEEKIISNSVFDMNVETNYVNTLKRDIGLKKKKTSEAGSSTTVQDAGLKSQSRKSDTTIVLSSNPYHYLIEPIETYLIDVKRLTIIPYGFLYLVPFSSLKTNQNQFLIEKYILSYVQSFSVLSFLIESVKSHNTVANKSSLPLIIGNPFMPLKDIEQLNGAEKEAMRIKSIIDGDVLIRRNANKVRVCQAIPGRSLVHFATHALLGDSVNEHVESVETDRVKIADITGDYSVKGAIVLAKSTDKCSGILTSSEIQNLDLSSCELITLSCCRTACGKVSGDGVLGLSRALLVGGARCIVNTLWAIEDEATVDLMTTFYSTYRETNDAALALRTAMITLISNGFKPDQWSGFSVTGVSSGMIGMRK